MNKEILFIPETVIIYGNSVFYKGPDGEVYPKSYENLLKRANDPKDENVNEFQNNPVLIKLIDHQKIEERYAQSYTYVPRYIDEEKNVKSYLDNYVIRACVNYGIKDGYINGKMVYAFSNFKSHNGWSDAEGKYPSYPRLIQVGSDEYVQGLETTEMMKKSVNLSKYDLIPGHHYVKIFNPEKYEIVTFLGLLKFANERWNSGNCGKRFTSIPVFIEYNEKGDKIFTIKKIDELIYEDTSKPIMPDDKLKEWLERFDSSPFSYNFWNQPGLVDCFAYLTKQDVNYMMNNRYKEITSLSFFRNIMQCSKDILQGPQQTLNCLDSTYYYLHHDVNEPRAYLIKSFNSVSFDCSDSSKPIQMTYVENGKRKYEDVVKEIGGDSRWLFKPDTSTTLPPDFPDTIGTSGIKCITNGGKYEFLGMSCILEVQYPYTHKDLLWKKIGNYGEWMVARKIIN